MGLLAPHLDILPQGQRQVWDRLASTPSHFILYGGTALALRLGHRESVDFDFFSSRPFQPLQLARTIPYLKNQVITQQEESTLSCDIDTEMGVVKISFFGDLPLGQIETPDRAEGNDVGVASLRDLFGMKCATVPQRGEIKDYLDIHTFVTEAGIDLAEGIACAKAIYGRQYNPTLTLQALSYFGDLSEPLDPNIESDLLAAVRSVSLRNLPVVKASRHIGDDV